MSRKADSTLPLFYMHADVEFYAVRQRASGIGEKSRCPYCGEIGTIARRFGNGAVFVVHKTEMQMLRGTIPAVIFVDGCWAGRKCGSAHEEFV